MNGVNTASVRGALELIKDGTVFENFAKDFLSKRLSHEFIPIGGIHDRGLDGVERIYNAKGVAKTVYQMSIQQTHKTKIKGTLETLAKNGITFDRFIYVTNVDLGDTEKLVEELHQEHGTLVTVRDQKWFVSNVNHSEATIRSFRIFVDTSLHEFAKPGAVYQVANLDQDPRVFVFLNQQWEDYGQRQRMDELLADSLILLALEGTDPDKANFRTRTEVMKRIHEMVKFDPKLLESVLTARLNALASKPRRISYHRKNDGFCLRYEERLAIEERNLKDKALLESFLDDTRKQLIELLTGSGFDPEVALQIVQTILHKIFASQGLEFAQFVAHGGQHDIFQRNLVDCVWGATSEQFPPNQAHTLTQLLVQVVRSFVYRGTKAQKEFLTKLSQTYMMMFLLQCEPQLATYFYSLAGKLTVYVDTSILIPALSEYYLEERNRRFYNLLRGAHRAGVKLVTNRTIVRELVDHFEVINMRFVNDYEPLEDCYVDDDQIALIPQIMIRAYFYAKAHGQIDSWQSFLKTFIDPRNTRTRLEDLVELLRTELGVGYVTDESLGIKISKQDVAALEPELQSLIHESSESVRHHKAVNDAHVILAIYQLREKNNETGQGDAIFGYRTWWLSSDIKTYKAVRKVFGKRFTESCYMRPDFLYNYISLAPSYDQANAAFAELFPTLLGVNISFRVPQEVSATISKYMKEHVGLPLARKRAVLRQLADKLKTDSTVNTREHVVAFLDTLYSAPNN
jgi:hypothetical protein